MEQLKIRVALEEDAKELSELICENANRLLKPHYNNQQWDIFLRYYSESEVTDKIRSQKVFCAELNSRIVGTIALDKNMVVGFYTRLDYTGRGFGKILISHLEAFAIEAGLTEIQLAASPAGLAFYYNNGWEKVRDFVVYHYGVGFEETLMRKKLD